MYEYVNVCMGTGASREGGGRRNYRRPSVRGHEGRAEPPGGSTKSNGGEVIPNALQRSADTFFTEILLFYPTD